MGISYAAFALRSRTPLVAGDFATTQRRSQGQPTRHRRNDLYKYTNVQIYATLAGRTVRTAHRRSARAGAAPSTNPAMWVENILEIDGVSPASPRGDFMRV
jgi:hypothetical protein